MVGVESWLVVHEQVAMENYEGWPSVCGRTSCYPATPSDSIYFMSLQPHLNIIYIYIYSTCAIIYTRFCS